MCDLELNYLCTYKLITEDDEDEKGATYTTQPYNAFRGAS